MDNMTYIDCIRDNRINADSYSLNMTIGEYYDLVKDCLNDNEYQRKRVRNSSSIYNLLKQDIIKGCVMPPLVLALCRTLAPGEDIEVALRQAKGDLKILDGLQRSYTIKEIVNECHGSLFGDVNPLERRIRVEVYVGINKLGILYRMLTLNAGQTQMTTRHQIEIIYSEYRNQCDVPGVTLFAETDGHTPNEIGEYKFRDVIEGFTSFLQRDYLTLDKKDILENVRDLERISRVATSNTLFYDFVDTYHHLVNKLNELFDKVYDPVLLVETANLSAAPFATSIISLFNKSQALTGYGCAIAEIMDMQYIKDIKDIHEYIENISTQNFDYVFVEMMGNLDYLRRNAKKIGNDQRKYFYSFFSSFFNNTKNSFLNFEASAKQAFEDAKRDHNGYSLF